MIRNAELSDFDAIQSIRERVALDVQKLDDLEYRLNIQRGGFLFPTNFSSHDFSTDLLHYSVTEQDGEVIGYFKLRDSQDIDPATEKIAWLKPELESVYFSNPHSGLDGIGVLPDN